MRPPHMTQCCAKDKAKERFLAEPCFDRFFFTFDYCSVVCI